MKAVAYYGTNDVRIEERPIPEPEVGQVLLRVAYCGICGSELGAIYKGGLPISNMYVPGRILGHEYTAFVHAVGPGVTTVKVGDRVVGANGCPCGECALCRRGEREICSNVWRPLGGAWADYTVVKAEMCFPLAPHVSMQVGSMAEPVASTLNTIDRADIKVGNTVLITGAGTMGLLLVQLVRLAGASLVIVSEPNAFKREMARQLGADMGLDPSQQDVVEMVKDATDGVGIDNAIEAAGFPAAVLTCLNAVRRGGTVILHGITSSDVEIPIKPYDLFRRVLTIKGTTGLQWSRALALISSGRLQLQKMITHDYPLTEIRAALDVAHHGDAVKVLVHL